MPLSQPKLIFKAAPSAERELVERWAPGRRSGNAYGPIETTACERWPGPLARRLSAYSQIELLNPAILASEPQEVAAQL